MKVIVTGATGFVGTELCKHLVAEGDDVLPLAGEGPEFLDILNGDGVREAFAGSGAEAVVHLAALSHVGNSFENPRDTLRVNVEGTWNVLDAAHVAGVGRVLVVGSAAEYGGSAGSEPITEECALRPVTPYGASKVAAEYLGLQAFLSRGLGTIMTRSFNHTGPGQSPQFVVPALARRVAQAEAEGRDEIEVGRLDSVREFNDVRDIVGAYRQLIRLGEAGSVYNVCSGVGYSIGEVAGRLIALANRPIRLHQDPALLRAVESARLVGDPSKLKSHTGWEPRWTLDQTLKDVLERARSEIRASSSLPLGAEAS